MIYFDLETTANGGPDGDSPEAHWKVNKVLLCGWATRHHSNIVVQDDTIGLAEAIKYMISETGLCDLVAHNAKFDIKYMMRDHPEIDWTKVKVWDTMTWEYLHSGHRSVMISLEDACAQYGISFAKSLDLGAILATGMKMEQIDRDELRSYLHEDVSALKALQLAQENQAEYFMDYLLPLAEMELNGLPLNVDKAEVLAYKLEAEVNESYEHIQNYIIENCEWQDGSSVTLDDFSDVIRPKSKFIKPTANRTISMLLTGEPAVLSITPKWKLGFKRGVAPLLTNSQVDRIYTEIEPTHVGYPVDEDTLNIINLELGNNVQMLEHLIRYRKGYKTVNTYLLPMMRQALIGGTVHPKLNTAITSTGRLSSSNPNGQNMPPEIRELIEAQAGNRIDELDFSQLEMVGAATLSGDPKMIHDLNHGVDIHYNTAASVFGADNAEEKRKLAKNVNFGVLYGGKAGGLSKQTGVDKDTITQLIEAFYDSYPAVAKWQRKLFEDVVDNMEAHDILCGEQRYRSDYILPRSGRKFRFIETEAPAWLRARTHRKFSFSPNHTANYPIQGFAGGDIVMYGLTHLWREVRRDWNWDAVRFRVTVHDSIMLERDARIDLTDYYNTAIGAIEKHFNLPVHLQFEVETGYHWS